MRKIFQILLLICFVGFFGCTKSKITEKSEKNLIEKDSIVSKEHIYYDLSDQNNFKLIFNEIYKKNEFQNHYWTILVYDKQMKLIDSIKQEIFVFDSEFVDFKSARSFLTEKNQSEQIVDNYAGDLVIADFNFDSKSDFAIINDQGGNGGVFYSYYIQQENNTFKQDKFLTENMIYFPLKFDKQNRTLTTYVHAGVCWLGEHIYKLDDTNNWSEISEKTIDICNENK